MINHVERISSKPKQQKNIIIKNCTPFTSCISEINNTQIDNAKDIDIVLPMCNLIKYSDNCSKTSGILWQYYRAESFLDNNGVIADFLLIIITVLRLNLKQK